MPRTHFRAFALNDTYQVADPSQLDVLHLDSPARLAMLDFSLHAPVTLSPETPVDEARQVLDHSHRAVVLVVDRHKRFCGAVTNERLSPQAEMRLVGRGRRREDLRTRDLMVPNRLIHAVDIHQLEKMRVENLIELLQQDKQTFLLVVNPDASRILGVVAAEHLSRQLHRDIPVEKHPSLAEMLDAVNH